MKHRTFGRSGIKVSEIVFGAGAVGGVIIHKDDATKREAIRRALAGGINWIDTAAQYGNGKSEEALGWLLPAAGANPYLSTKFGLDVENLKDVPAQIEKSLLASLARLKRSSVDLLQLHNRIGSKPGGRVMTVEQILDKNGVADGLERLREKGLIRHMGITAIGETASVCEVIRSKRFDSAQVYYNLLNPSAGRSMPLRSERSPTGNVSATAGCRRTRPEYASSTAHAMCIPGRARARSVTAGMWCTTSPSDESFTKRTRCAGMAAF